MAKNKPENTAIPEDEEITRVSREELKQAKREAKAAKQNAAKKAEKEAASESGKSGKGKAQSNANQKPKLTKRIGKALKEMISELKKVNWPKGKTVLSSTLVVITVVLAFLIILTAMDFGLGRLLELLVTRAG